MEKKETLINELNDDYFWDTDTSKMRSDISKRLIIERVFSLGSIRDMRNTIAHYGKDKIAEELGKINYLDPKTCNFVSVIFDTPKEEFRCNTPKPLNQRHWSS